MLSNDVYVGCCLYHGKFCFTISTRVSQNCCVMVTFVVVNILFLSYHVHVYLTDCHWRDSINIRKVKPNYYMMLKARREDTDVGDCEKSKNQRMYRQAVSKYALVNIVTIVMRQVLNHAGSVPGARQTGWWNLTDGSRNNKMDPYIEKMPIIPVPQDPTDKISDGPAIIIVSIVAGIILFLLLIALVTIVSHRKAQRLFSPQIEDFLKGTPIDPEYQLETCSTNSTAHGIPYHTSYEISTNMLRIETDHPLGEGNFGYVYKATINYDDENVDVALKMTRRSVPKSAIKGLLSEINILTYLGKHANIVALKAVCTSELEKGIVYLATELCSLGSLEGYLRARTFVTRENSCQITNENTEFTSDSVDYQNVISLHDMLQWAYDIACGMEYLGTKHVVHADLATRNVLLTSNKTAKISDFGLSRRMYNYQTYVKKGEEPLPWRWMAIESLKKCEFSAQSDVWSYGVTLWEIFALGDTPYPGMSWTPDFADRLVGGLRLQCPKFATEKIFSIMSLCWHDDPNERISFTSLRDLFHSQIDNATGYDEYVTSTYIIYNEMYLGEMERAQRINSHGLV